MRKYLPLFLIPASLFFFSWAGFLVWQRNRPLSVPTVNTSSKSDPITLIIPELNITLPILSEPLTSKGVTYEPHGNNLVFYGHNWPNILAPLHQAKLGQKIIISYADGLTKQFEIKNISVVPGSQISLLQPPPPNPQLIIYTCTGFLDRQRLVVTAFPT